MADKNTVVLLLDVIKHALPERLVDDIAHYPPTKPGHDIVKRLRPVNQQSPSSLTRKIGITIPSKPTGQDVHKWLEFVATDTLEQILPVIKKCIEVDEVEGSVDISFVVDGPGPNADVPAGTLVLYFYLGWAAAELKIQPMENIKPVASTRRVRTSQFLDMETVEKRLWLLKMTDRAKVLAADDPVKIITEDVHKLTVILGETIIEVMKQAMKEREIDMLQLHRAIESLDAFYFNASAAVTLPISKIK